MSSVSSSSSSSTSLARPRRALPVAASPSAAATSTTSLTISPTFSLPSSSSCSPAFSSSSSSSSSPASPPSTCASPPAPTEDPAHIASARAAIIASVSNFFDPEMRARARDLHAGHAAITAQQTAVQKSTAQLARHNDALGALVTQTEKKVKELGSLRNWAELLERELLTLERTVRIAHGDDSEDEDAYSTCSESEDGSAAESDSEADETGQPGPSDRSTCMHKPAFAERQITQLYSQPSALSTVDYTVASFSPTAPPSATNNMLLMRSLLRP